MKPIIDISHYQKHQNINYKELSKHIGGVIIRATYGSGYWGTDNPDLEFPYHYNGFSEQGVPVGFYHFLTEYQEHQAQLDLLMEAVDGLTFHLLGWMDVEWEAGAQYLKPESVKAFNLKLDGLLGRHVGNYSRADVWDRLFSDPYGTEPDRGRWAAAYAETWQERFRPEGWNPIHLWQYTSKLILPGYAYGLDASRLQVPDDEWQKLLGNPLVVGAEPIPDPDPEPEPEPVEIPLFRAKVYADCTPWLLVRRSPAVGATIIGKLMPKTIVEVYEIVGDWYRHATGYSSSKYMQRLDVVDPPAPTESGYFGPIYCQRDLRWKDETLGTKSTIGANGCLITDMSMLANAFGHASNPHQLNMWLTNNGGYFDGNLYVWQAITKLYPNMIWERFVYNPSDAQVLAELKAGNLPVIWVDFNNATEAIEMHWVLAIGYEGSKILIADPWTGEMLWLRDRYTRPMPRYAIYRRA